MRFAHVLSAAPPRTPPSRVKARSGDTSPPLFGLDPRASEARSPGVAAQLRCTDTQRGRRCQTNLGDGRARSFRASSATETSTATTTHTSSSSRVRRRDQTSRGSSVVAPRAGRRSNIGSTSSTHVGSGNVPRRNRNARARDPIPGVRVGWLLAMPVVVGVPTPRRRPTRTRAPIHETRTPRPSVQRDEWIAGRETPEHSRKWRTLLLHRVTSFERHP